MALCLMKYIFFFKCHLYCVSGTVPSLLQIQTPLIFAWTHFTDGNGGRGKLSNLCSVTHLGGVRTGQLAPRSVPLTPASGFPRDAQPSKGPGISRFIARHCCYNGQLGRGPTALCLVSSPVERDDQPTGPRGRSEGAVKCGESRAVGTMPGTTVGPRTQ